MDIVKPVIEKLLFPAMELKNGNRIREYTKELLKTGELSREELQRLQDKRLSELLLHCAENVPAYSYLNSPELLSEIKENPQKLLRERVHLLKKQDYKAHMEDYHAVNFSESDRIPNRTGGSTAEPMQFYMSRAQVEHYEAARYRGLAWNGISFASRSVMLWGNQYELSQNTQKKYALKEKYLKNRVLISCFDMKPSETEKYIAFLNDYKPEFLYGYSGALAAFAKLVNESGKEKLHISLKGILATSETLFPWQKQLIEETFGTRVLLEYGARDAGILAFSCEKGGSHLCMENAVFEVLDPISFQPVEDGKPGVLAVTDLFSRVQPRLRYLLGDTVVIDTEDCSCGRKLPLLKAVEGREDAILVGTDGSLIHGDIVAQTIRDYFFIKNGRFVQHTPLTATLMLSFDEGTEEEKRINTANEIAKKLKTRLGDIEIKTEFPKEILPSGSGKMRYSIREFELK